LVTRRRKPARNNPEKLKTRKPKWVVSKDGLSMVRQSDGAVIKVFDGTDWMSEKRKK
jgi:hypothetical protein